MTIWQIQDEGFY